MSEALNDGVGLVAEQLRRTVPGGIGTYATGLINGLSSIEDALRPSLVLIASAPRGEDRLAAFHLPVIGPRLPSRVATRAWGKGLLKVRRPLSLVHALSLVVPPTDAPLVVTVHDLAWRTLPETFTAHGRRWHERSLHQIARRAAHIVTPSVAVAEELIEAGLGIRSKRITVVEEGSDHLPEPDHEGATWLLERLGVHDEFLLCVGTLEPRKNLRRLALAYGEARERLPESWPLVVVGPTGWGHGEPAAAEGVLLAGAVSGPVLASLYAKARVFIYVPLNEGFGLPVVEAMRSKVPVLSSPVPAAADATLLVDPLDVESITEGICTLALDETERQRVRAAGTARVAPLTWEATARRHLAVWEEVVAS